MEHIIEEFAVYFRRRGRSPETIRSYRKNLLQFCNEKDIRDVTDITRDVINDWILELRDRKVTDGTIANLLWSIKALLSWLHKEKQVECYHFDIEIPRVKEPTYVEYLEPDELEIIFSLIDHESLDGMRLRTYIEVMINTGLRPSEALNLRIDEIIGNEISIIGKGKKERKVYINERTRHWIDAYRSMRKDNCPALFVTNPKYSPVIPRAISLNRMEEQFRWMFQKTGIQKRVTLHTLRHTYATTLLANGCPIDYVARLLGHAKCETTRRHYISIQHKHAKKAHFRFLSYDANAPVAGGDQPLSDGHVPIAEPQHRGSYQGNATYIQ